MKISVFTYQFAHFISYLFQTNSFIGLPHIEWLTFLLPPAFLTIPKTYMLRFTSSSKELKFECYFLLFTFILRYSWCAFRSNFPIDLVEFWATLSWAVSSFFFSFNTSIFSLRFSIILCLRLIFCFGFSSFSYFYFSGSSVFRPFLMYLTLRSMKWGFGFFICMLLSNYYIGIFGM